MRYLQVLDTCRGKDRKYQLDKVDTMILAVLFKLKSIVLVSCEPDATMIGLATWG